MSWIVIVVITVIIIIIIIVTGIVITIIIIILIIISIIIIIIDGHRQKKELYKSGFGSPACSMLYLPTTLDSTARTVIVGFADGVVRALLMCSDAWKVTVTFKPHSGAVCLLVG